MFRIIFYLIIMSVFFFCMSLFIAGGELDYKDWETKNRVGASIVYVIFIVVTVLIAKDTNTEKEEENKRDYKNQESLEKKFEKKLIEYNNNILIDLKNELALNKLNFSKEEPSAKIIVNAVIDSTPDLNIFNDEEKKIIVSSIKNEDISIVKNYFKDNKEFKANEIYIYTKMVQRSLRSLT